MLFAGWEARIVKNCDLGSENATLGRTTLGRQITFYFIFFPAVNWFYRLSQMVVRNCVTESACVPSTNNF